MLNKIKSWFKHSETIFLARLEAFIGVLVAGLAALDFSHIISLSSAVGFDWKQVVVVGGIMFVSGIVREWLRKRNEPNF